VLKYRPKVDSVLKHKASMAGRMESSMEAMGQTMRAEITMDMDYSEKVLSQTDETTRVETELLGGKTEVNMAGMKQTIDMPTGKMVTDLDPRGQVVKLVEADLTGTDQQVMGQGSESFPNWSQFSAFPEGDIKEGDSWKGTVTIPMGPDAPTIEMSYTSKLIALTTFQDRKCAKLQTGFSAPLELDASQLGGGQGSDGNVNATLSGDILWYYDYENSVYVYGEGTVGMDMDMSMSAPNMPSGNVKTKMLLNIKTSLVP